MSVETCGEPDAGWLAATILTIKMHLSNVLKKLCFRKYVGFEIGICIPYTGKYLLLVEELNLVVAVYVHNVRQSINHIHVTSVL